MTSTEQETRSADHRLPIWLRLVALAVEEAEPDFIGGYIATFNAGELRHLLQQSHPSVVTRAIRRCEQYGLLAVGSSSRCLRLGRLTTGPDR